MAGILLTGFSPFPGAPVNPTGTLTEGLAARVTRRGLGVAAAVLTTEYAAAETTLSRLLEEYDPTVVLHFGLSARARGLRIERRALNRASTFRADACGQVPQQGVIEPAGPAMRLSSLPVERALAGLGRAGLAASVSLDAGDYLCNYVFYRSLAMSVGRRRVVGFIHVPMPTATGGGVGNRRNRLDADDLLDGAQIILEVALSAVRLMAA